MYNVNASRTDPILYFKQGHLHGTDGKVAPPPFDDYLRRVARADWSNWV